MPVLCRSGVNASVRARRRTSGNRMTLAQLIRDEKKAVVERWYDMVLATYPAQTAKMWKANKDPFGNPVGQTTLRSLEELTDHLV